MGPRRHAMSGSAGDYIGRVDSDKRINDDADLHAEAAEGAWEDSPLQQLWRDRPEGAPGTPGTQGASNVQYCPGCSYTETTGSTCTRELSLLSNLGFLKLYL